MTNEADPADLPGYTQPDIKAALLDAGASGTIYALVMPESQQAMTAIIDGCDMPDVLQKPDASTLLRDARQASLFDMYLEPWTMKQDAMHEEYFSRWLEWSAPVVSVDGDAFSHRYPTAGASEGIFKLMSEYAAASRAAGRVPTIHMFEGEYEGFSAFAGSLEMDVVRHRRDDWIETLGEMDPHAQFWISQPSAIDGGVWDKFGAFVSTIATMRPDVEIVPDLSYVGAVAREYRIDLDSPNIRSFVISHSKPFGGYYNRCGGVFARENRPSLFGNRWFKNLLSLAWGVEMMKRNDVFALPRRYRDIQTAAADVIAARLGIERLEPCDVFLLATAPVPTDPSATVSSILRGVGADRCVRVCLTPTMTVMVDPTMAPTMSIRLAANQETAKNGASA